MSRRTQIHLRPSDLIAYLGLPAGTRVLAFAATVDPPGARIVIEHPGLPEVPEDQEAPFTFPVSRVTDGRLEFVWNFGDRP